MIEYEERHALVVALLQAQEALSGPWALDRRVDVVRVLAPSLQERVELAQIGFVVKPTMVTWVAPLGRDEDAFFTRLDSKATNDIRRSRRHATGLRLVIERPLGKASLEDFLRLYVEQMAEIRHGVAFALRHRKALLESQNCFGVFMYDGSELVGGAVLMESANDEAVRLRFSAVASMWRRRSLSRALYFAAFREARERGFRYVTLGDDPNLFGHIAAPGLFRFKASMGFEAVPSQDFGDSLGDDRADFVLELTTLSDPSVILAYANPADPEDRRLTAEIIAAGGPETSTYEAPFVTDVRVRRPGVKTNTESVAAVFTREE